MVSVILNGGSWRRDGAGSFSWTLRVGWWTQVVLHADEAEAIGCPIRSVSSTAGKLKREIDSGSVDCKGLPVTYVWHEGQSERVRVPRVVVNSPRGHRGLTLF